MCECDGTPTTECADVAVRGSGSYVVVADVVSSYDQQSPLLAQTILNSFQIVSAPANAITTTTPSATATTATTAASSGTLLQFNGSGDQQSANFSVSSGQAQVCWNVLGRSPSSLALGPDVSIFIEPVGTGSYGNDFNVNDVEQNCSYAHLDPGTYYVKVIATSWSQWSVTLTGS